jgi:hypothetical protein
MKGAGPHLHVVRLVNHATLIGPKFVQDKDQILKIHGRLGIEGIFDSGFSDAENNGAS